MVQLYFLSIVFNGLSGFLFLLGDFGGNAVADENRKFSFASGGLRLVMGILTGLTGVLKLLSPFEGVFFIGDLLPAAAGIGAGFMLIYGFYRERAPAVDSDEKINRFGDTILYYRKAAGIALLVIAALHFIFARLPLL